ncbi:hypothetical protein [Streptomyces sp. NPDC005209]|uniref:hypothetical protein n=1 Tax=Streptomyces sp. NPDC005209 TaxID=3156715 RepID=UPI0033B0894F
MTVVGVEVGAQAARSRALAVLRIRGRALAVALLPAAAAVILLAGGSTGHLLGEGWDTARWIVSGVALLVLAAAAGIALVVARARPAVSPTVPIAEESAPDLYRMVRDLADRLDVPAPSAIALTPDCDSWLEDRTHPAHGPPPPEHHDELSGLGRRPRRRTAAAPVLVIGSPFLWWMRVGELRAVLAPVVAGTGPSAHPDIAAARRFVRGLDAAVAVTSAPGRGPVSRTVLAGVGWVARLLLRGCREHATEMERGVAAAAAERAQAVDYGLRIVAQEQVGLAYAGWDRLLTRVALPAWRMGRWPSRLDAGVVAALTELSRRDRLAEGFASRLGERPACDLLEEPGAVDEAASLLAARLFHGGPAEQGPDWSPVDWQEYPEEVVDRKWRTDAARLHRVLDSLAARPTHTPTSPDPTAPTLSRVLDHLATPHDTLTTDTTSLPGTAAGAGTSAYAEDEADRGMSTRGEEARRGMSSRGEGESGAGLSSRDGGETGAEASMRGGEDADAGLSSRGGGETGVGGDGRAGAGMVARGEAESGVQAGALGAKKADVAGVGVGGEGGASAGASARGEGESGVQAGALGAKEADVAGVGVGGEGGASAESSTRGEGESGVETGAFGAKEADAAGLSALGDEEANAEMGARGEREADGDLGGPSREAGLRAAEGDDYTAEGAGTDPDRPSRATDTSTAANRSSSSGPDATDAGPGARGVAGATNPHPAPGPAAAAPHENVDTGRTPAKPDGYAQASVEPDGYDRASAKPDGHDHTPMEPGDYDDEALAESYGHDDEALGDMKNQRGAALAARLSAELAREEAPGTVGAAQGGAGASAQGPGTALWDDCTLPLFPLQPPRTARELLADHVTAMVCCAAMDTAGATPGLDWLDGPSLLLNGERAADLNSRVLSLTEDGDPAPLRAWLIESGIRPEKPVRLV